MKNLPNILSISRIFLGATILFTYSFDDIFHYNLTVSIIIIAILTDFLDGAIARKYDLVSKEGYIWDGLGDRSFYIALILIFFMKFGVYIFIVWALIFREVSIYALRLLNRDWKTYGTIRKISLLHATGIRLWILNYLISDALKYYYNVLIVKESAFVTLQYSIILLTISIAYYGLFLYIKDIFKLRK